MLKKLDTLLQKATNAFLVITLLITSIIIFVNVILRYFFSSGIVGSEELVRYLMIGMVFIGGSTLILDNEQLTMDALISYLPKYLMSIASILVSFIGILFSIALTFYSFNVILNLSMSVTPALQIPSYIPYLFIPIGSLLTAIRFIQRLTLDFRVLFCRKGVGK